jgi:peptide-methionine (S)-S-oxide reductase
VVAGYAGGTLQKPSYEQVCSGTTGHAEVARITFDPSRISYERLLEVFWAAHDPTTLDRQGADSGPQYRSVIFYHNEHQRAAAEKSRAGAQKEFSDKIVTAIEPLRNFYPAEDYHQDYFRNHQNAPYCVFVISPKLKKLHLK